MSNQYFGPNECNKNSRFFIYSFIIRVFLYIFFFFNLLVINIGLIR